MGFRFRKSFKVAPGVRVNLNKKSTSVSFGGKGIRHTISSTGRQTSSIGIPGSGLYYTKSTSSKNKTSKDNKDNNNPTNLEDSISEYNAAVYRLTNMHNNLDISIDWDMVANTPPPFDKSNKGPNQIKAEKKLDTYAPGLLDSIFKSRQESKIDELKKNIKLAVEDDLNLYQEWEKSQKQANYIKNKDLKGYLEIIKDINLEDLLEGYVKSFQIGYENDNNMIIEYEQIIDSIFPEKYPSITNAGNLSMKKYNKTEYNDLIKRYVCGFAFRIARNFFELFPIDNITINSTQNKINTTTGHLEENTLLSVVFNRNTMNKINFEHIDPLDALENFQHNVRFLKTKGFQPIEKIYNIDN